MMAELDQNSIFITETNVFDEDRVRKLFQTCDTDGDGYIDSRDLLTVCQELNLENSLEELMKELGADENGRISFKEFSLRRLALHPEIEALRTSSPHDTRESVTPEYLITSSDNSLSHGEPSSGKCGESWEFDSGARDLSPEPNTLQRLVEAAGCSLTATNTASLLELANKLHLAALASLRGEILELTTRLHTLTQERDILERKAAQAENAVAQQYEERLTELHSVIAELSRKVDRQKCLVIPEDDEPSETDQSIETCSETEEIRTSDLPTVSASNKFEKTFEKTVGVEKKSCQAEDMFCDLEAENIVLKEELAKSKANLCQIETLLTCAREDAGLFLTKAMSEHQSVHKPGSLAFSYNESPVLKVAERVRIKKIGRHITGFDLSAFGVNKTKVAEQLVSELQDECNLQELNSLDIKQLQLEVERLNCQLEHSRSQVSVLQSVLEETKFQCERLYLLVGKHESNAIASCLALSLSERVIEAYDLLLSLQDRHTPTDKNQKEEEIRKLILELKVSKNLTKSTIVELEGFTENITTQPTPIAQSRKPDLEIAVLMQELMAMREDKADLRAQVYLLQKEKENQELKFATIQSQQQANLAKIQHLQYQLQELDLKERHAEGPEDRLHERLKEVACSLKSIRPNAKFRQRETLDLQTINRCRH